MKLIIPIPYYRPGGIERVMISLITEIAKQIDQVIIVSSSSIINYFIPLIPPSEKIIYEEFKLPLNTLETKQFLLINKFINLVNKLNFNKMIVDFLQKFTESYKTKIILEYFINKYQVNCCLYLLVNRVNPPQLKIPLFAVINDLFWHFSPLTYDQNYIKIYDQSLLKWLQCATKIITISEQTKKDILSLFPDFNSKIMAIPLAGFLPSSEINVDDYHQNNKEIIFYFPSSFGIYKDHLTLLKAGLILAKKGLNFKIVLIGKETDKFVTGNLTLSQQNQTQEYNDHFKECQSIFKENKELISNYFLGLGYCDNTKVEKWYQQANCIVFPSKYEGFGLALSEGIVRGIPVIASDLDVFKEQVDLYKCDDLVQFFARGNYQELADKMEFFIHNPILKLSSDDAFKRFNNWTWKKVAMEYIRVLINID